MFRRVAGIGRVAAAAVVFLCGSCTCGSDPAATDDAADVEPCDPAACASQCRAEGRDCGRCLDELGCRCGIGYYACDGDLPPRDASEEDDAPPPCPEGSVPPPEAGRWIYPEVPLWEREVGDEWDFAPPTWDISAYRMEPVPGCERIIFPPFTDGGQDAALEGDRVASVQMATVCTDRGPEDRHVMFMVDLARNTMALAEVADGPTPAIVSPPSFVDGGGTAYCITVDGAREQFVVLLDGTAGRKRMVRRWTRPGPFNETGGVVSLHGSGSKLLAGIAVGSCCSNFEVYDTVTRTWTVLTDFDGGIRTFESDFSGERAVWDVWNNRGIMTATLSDRETELIAQRPGVYQWRPSVWGDRVCWGAGCPGPSTTIIDPAAPPCRVECADLDEGVMWDSSMVLGPDEVTGSGEIGPFVHGDWVVFGAWNPVTDTGRWVFYHWRLRRIFEFTGFPGLGSLPEPVGQHWAHVYYFGSESIPRGHYRCDLRVLFPEAYAAMEPVAPAEPGPAREPGLPH